MPTPPRIPAEYGRRFDPGRLVLLIPIVLILILLLSSVYTVGPDEVGVVQRFGAYHSMTESGLHFKTPLGVDKVTKVPTNRQLKHEFGFETERADVHTRYRPQSEEMKKVSLMVSGDLNMAIVEWIIQYRITDARNYLFKLRAPENTLRDAAESVMREVVGDHTVDEVLTIGRNEIEDAAKTKLQALVTAYEMGVRIETIQLQDVTPPDEVKASFSEVNQAQQEREKLINLARAEYNKVVPLARGEALQKIQAAEGYAMERVNHAQGDATKFNAMLTAYLQAPEVTRRRMYLETMGDVIPRVGRKFVIDRDVQQLLPLLSIPGAEEAKQ